MCTTPTPHCSRVSTGRLNRFVRKLELQAVGSGTATTLARVKYMTQVPTALGLGFRVRA